MMERKLRDLTPEELRELCNFAAIEGRKWKDVILYQYWMRGITVRDRKCKEYPLLYGLRNTHGPTWLDKFKLPPPIQN